MKHVAYVTGTRADYGLMRGVLHAIDEHPVLRLSLIVTGMHLLQDFGDTLKDVEQDGFEISSKVSMMLGEDSPAAMAKSLGFALIGLTQAFEQIRPDVILLEGDRGESLAAAIAAGHMGICIAHVSGGDVTAGVIDESIRHAITKFAHIHFPGTDLSARRLLAMGESPKHIHMIGTPGSDLTGELDMTPEEVGESLDMDVNKPIILVLQHPETMGSEEDPASQMRETMEAVCEVGEQTLVIYPNSDAGGREMISVIESYRALPSLKIHGSLSRPLYVGLLSVAHAMVGNSSSSLTDAPNFGLPAINVGVRQAQRERGGNLIDVGADRAEIVRAIRHVLEHRDDQDFRDRCRQTPYKDEDSGGQIATVLAATEFNIDLFRKAFCDAALIGCHV